MQGPDSRPPPNLRRVPSIVCSVIAFRWENNIYFLETIHRICLNLGLRLMNLASALPNGVKMLED